MIKDLTQVRKALAEFKRSEEFDPFESLSEQEQAAVNDLDLGYEGLRTRINRWLTLLIANTVFEVSNADPGVSKAYKSKKMRRKIDEGEHPPDVLETHQEQIAETKGDLIKL